jgi:hypothetical protein
MGAEGKNGRRVYGVHLNEYGEIFAIDGGALQPTGRFRDAQDERLVTRSRTVWFAGGCDLLKTEDNVRALLAYRNTALLARRQSSSTPDLPPAAVKFARRLEMIEKQLRNWGIDF